MLKKVSLKHNSKYLFKDISLTAKKGQWISILGKSGVGKSTIIRLIAGLDTFGEITGDITNNQSIAWMGQTDLLYPWLSVMDNVLLPITMANKKPSNTEINKAKSLLKKVGINSNKLNELPMALSGGQRQRVALARTLMIDADVVLMDEPFSALDAITKKQCQNLFCELLSDKTVIMVTHDVMEAIRVSNTIYVMNKGLDKASELKSKAPRDLDDKSYVTTHKKLWGMLEQ